MSAGIAPNYPLYAWDFLISSDYNKFASQVEEKFILSPKQWEQILEHWEQKELILTSK